MSGETIQDSPNFKWILRDFSLALVDKDGSSLSSNKYLDNCLSAQAGDA